MKLLSETYKELGIAFKFPIKIRDSDGNKTYHETSDGFWYKYEYDSSGNETYFEDSRNYWCKKEYNSDGKETYYETSKGFWYKKEYNPDGEVTYHENSYGNKEGTPRSAKTCEGKVIEVDGIKYELKLKN